MVNLSVGDFLKLIPDYVIKVAEELQANGYEAYLVGGSIRDVLLEKIPDDYDVATNAMPDAVSKIFPRSVPTGAKFGTITVITEDEHGEKFDVQVTTYRSEADYIGGRWPSKVEFARTIEEDLSRRDFTINAIALDLRRFDEPEISVQQILVDPFEGIKDLETRIVRAVRDPLERFSEDGLRSVRACRLASQLDFDIEEQTFNAIRETLHITKQVSVERFREELMKLLLKSPLPSKGLRLMKESGVLELFIPELLEGIDVVQPQFHTDDVFDHLIKTVDYAEDSVKVAALFHDIAKPRTRSEDEQGIHFYGHDVQGAEMTQVIMRRLKFPNAEIDRVSRLVRWHMFYYPSADWRVKNPASEYTNAKQAKKAEAFAQNEDGIALSELMQLRSRAEHGWTDGAIRRLIQNVGGEDAIDDLMRLRIADATANPKSEFDPKELDTLSERIAEVRAKEMALKVSDLDITGEDLIENFGLSPGPKLGAVLKHLLDLVIDEPAYNKKIDLLRLAKEYLEQEREK